MLFSMFATRKNRRRDAGATKLLAAFLFDCGQARESQILRALEFRNVDDLAGVISEMFSYMKNRIHACHVISLNFILPCERIIRKLS